MAINVGSVIHVENIEFSVIGIDCYSLLNMNGRKRKWISFTIKNKNKKQWIVRGINNKEILWEKSKQLKNAIIQNNYRFNPIMSGIATIQFRGNKGFSTPLAEIIWFDSRNKNNNSDYYVQENFLVLKKNNLKYQIKPFVYAQL